MTEIKTLIFSLSFILAPLLTNQPISKGKDSKGKEPKVTICHVPPGNPSNVHSITISKNAVEAHLAHGDFFGNCGGGTEQQY
ncbi:MULTISPECIES: hypothetical protein [Tenacibaculum]|uniref:Uncharacterized protein n=1 Tax=Tenacibaculum caenipelagi TaxID=1325435 RepID=A0A4R6TBB5_9FLAO|nr:hypothetical protein [Tenacibaculum caenipelagi]TDQ25481.1 hypothetical protein DFQ07_1903 [Tenacibaculum caenipelagi]